MGRKRAALAASLLASNGTAEPAMLPRRAQCGADPEPDRSAPATDGMPGRADIDAADIVGIPVTIRLAPEIHRRLELVAVRAGVCIQDIVLELLTRYLADDGANGDVADGSETASRD